MKESEVKELARNGIFQRMPIRGNVEETHISWVILTKRHAFKFKKPVRLSFLNFSTLQLRKYFCEREVALNSRFTDIYLDVVPIRIHNKKWYIGRGAGRIVDYAVQMKRMRATKRMDNVLQRKQVDQESISALAKVIASFHRNADMVKAPFRLLQARNLFNDISMIQSVVTEQLGFSYTKIINRSIRWSNNFLKLHAARIQQRIDLGFKRDVHGDLHSGNIFFYRTPVLFDCIEFNDQFRQIDVLYEIAFLCMDLDAWHEKLLAKVLLAEYTRNFPCFEGKEDEMIFVYFKCLRANVRAKVHAMSVEQALDQHKVNYHADETRKYLTLMKAYLEE